MRKARGIAVVLCLCLWLGGCGSPPAPSREDQERLMRLSQGFSATAALSGGDFSARASIVQASPLSCKVTFVSPESIAGLAASFEETGLTMSLGELAFSFDSRDALPAVSLPRVLAECLNRAAAGELVREGEALRVSGLADCGEFTLLLTGDGLPEKLLLPGEKWEIEFSDIEYFT